MPLIYIGPLYRSMWSATFWAFTHARVYIGVYSKILMLLNVFFTSVWIFILEKDCLHEEKLSFAKHWKRKQNMNVSYAKKSWSRKLSLWYNTIFETLKLIVMGSGFLWNQTSSCIFESFIIRFFGITCLLQLNV